MGPWTCHVCGKLCCEQLFDVNIIVGYQTEGAADPLPIRFIRRGLV